MTCLVGCRSMNDQLPPSLTVLVIIDFAPAEAWRSALIPKISAFLDSWPMPIFAFFMDHLVCWRILLILVSNNDFQHMGSNLSYTPGGSSVFTDECA